jgi:uncharacterized protein (DUF2252 family)
MASTVRALIDPAELARAQLARDQRRSRARPWLFAVKSARMGVSPFHFLRGAAPLFYAVLRQAPRLAEGPAGDGWLAGDLHLENFGVYRPQPPGDETPAAAVVFDVNDFDDAFVGPQRLDVLRLLTSTVLVARTWGLRSAAIRAAAEAALDGVLAGRSNGKVEGAPGPVRDLLARVAARTRRQLLDARTERTPRGRLFVRGPRYRSLSEAARGRAQEAFARYLRSLPAALLGRRPDAWTVRDVAFRVAGTGSLGLLRIAILVEGKGGPDGGWIFDMKEERVPAGASFATGQSGSGAGRVLAAMRDCLARPPRMAGQTHLGTTSLLVRRLMPQEDRLAFERLAPADREPVLRYLGFLTGAFQRRSTPALAAWRATAARVLIDSAVTLAGLHEAAAVHYATVARDG